MYLLQALNLIKSFPILVGSRQGINKLITAIILVWQVTDYNNAVLKVT